MLKMDMERRGLIPEDKHLVNQKWSYLWAIPGKEKIFGLQK